MLPVTVAGPRRNYTGFRTPRSLRVSAYDTGSAVPGQPMAPVSDFTAEDAEDAERVQQ